MTVFAGIAADLSRETTYKEVMFLATKGSDSDKSQAKGGKASGTRVEVTLPLNQGMGLIPPVFTPPAAGQFIQPVVTGSGLFGVISPMGLPGTTPAPTGPPNIIVTVPPRVERGTNGAGMQNNGDSSGDSEIGESDQSPEE